MFIDGEYFDDVIETEHGPVRVLADIHIFGKHLVLDGLLFFPEEGESLNIGVRLVLRIARNLRIQAKADGFQELTTVYSRLGKGRSERIISHTRSLE